VNRLIDTPRHEAVAEGYVGCPALGGKRPVSEGVFNLLVDDQDPDRKAMYYRLFFTDDKGNPLTLLGFKDVRGAPGSDVWTETTTLFTRILRGHVGPEADGGANVLAAGIIHIHMLDFFEELTTFRVDGPSVAARADGLTRFGKLFLGKLWDVYARHILPASPI
jgi:cholesterol oxidase